MVSESTNPQGATQTFTPPKNVLREPKEKIYGDISAKWFIITGCWCVLSLVFGLPIIIIQKSLLQNMFIAAFVVWWVVYFLNIRTVEMYDETVLTIKFFIAGLMGKHTVCVLDMDLETLQSYIPIVKIHDKGLIEFTQHRFGVIIDYISTVDPEMDLESHYVEIGSIHDRLVAGMLLKWIALSKFGTPALIMKKLEKQMRDPKTTKKQFEFFESQYKEIKKGKITPDWEFTAFLGLGTFEGSHENTNFIGRVFVKIKNLFKRLFKVNPDIDTRTPLQRAQDKMEEELPGFLDGLIEAKMIAYQVTDNQEIIKKYIRHMVPRDI
jgi:hypothetical protein